MREYDEITDLFRSRLVQSEMTVRDGFWESLEGDLPKHSSPKLIPFSPKRYRVAAAASVVFVLGAASAAFWHFSPKEEIKEAFTQMAVLTPEGSLNGDVVQESFPSIHQADPVAPKPGIHPSAGGAPAGLTVQAEEEGAISVRVSIRITQRTYGDVRPSGSGFYGTGISANGRAFPSDAASSDRNVAEAHPSVISSEKETATGEARSDRPRNWALKAGIGTSLPKGDFKMPLTAGVSVERRLNRRFSLEAGLQYNRLRGDRTLHTLGIPVRLNMMLASTPKVDLYALAGGAVEKCIAGAPDNGFDAEPVQLSVAAGVGMRYKLSDRFALFAEPSVSHHFGTDSSTGSLRKERPTNLNLLCGVRMTY